MLFSDFHFPTKKRVSHVLDMNSPRYFVVYPDGSGEELLRYEDVSNYMINAESDPAVAVLNSKIEGNDEGKSLTVIKPHVG